MHHDRLGQVKKFRLLRFNQYMFSFFSFGWVRLRQFITGPILLNIFLTYFMSCHWQAFPAYLMFVDKSSSLPQSGAPERCFPRIGSAHTCQHQNRLERPASDQNSSLFGTIVSYGRKKFCNIVSRLSSVNLHYFRLGCKA